MPVYQDKKLKTWFIKFRYRDWQGKARETTKRGFKTKRDALKYEIEFKATSRDIRDIKCAELVEKYLEDKKIMVKTSTFKNIEGQLKKYFLPYFGQLKISELRPLELKGWQNELIKTKLRYRTISSIRTTINSMLIYAVKYYGLKENPLRLIDNLNAIKKREKSKATIWTYKEFEKFISVVKNVKHKICFKLLFYGGMRVGELLALNKRDFNFKENTISITKNKAKSTGEITTPKTPESEREILIPASLMKEVRQYIKNMKVVSTTLKPVFQITNNSLLKALKTCAEKAGVKKIRVHDLRHSHASHLIHLGIPITTISRRLGHKSPRITLEVYSHMYAESEREAVNLLENEIKEHENIK